MSHARQMLDAAPAEVVEFEPGDLTAAIDASLDAAQACVACADACLAEENVADLRACIGLDEDCADVCIATARVLSRSARYDKFLVQRLLEACVRACSSCAAECRRHAEMHQHCAVCAEACAACETACRVLLQAEAFGEVQALAGG
jgi:hypothetical protein